MAYQCLAPLKGYDSNKCYPNPVLKDEFISVSLSLAPEKLTKMMETKSASTAKDISGEIAISQKGHDESIATLDEPSDARMSLAQHEVI